MNNDALDTVPRSKERAVIVILGKALRKLRDDERLGDAHRVLAASALHAAKMICPEISE